MKPRTKLQHQIVAQSHNLPKISPSQRAWAFNTRFEHIARVTKGGDAACLECGGAWFDKHIATSEQTTCPHCGATLKVRQTRSRNFHDVDYVSVITTCGGYQVLRFLYVSQSLRVGREAYYFASEVVQRWIAPDGRSATLAKLRPINCWVDSWQWGSDLELRLDKPLYDIMPSAVYPRMRVIPQLKRGGFEGNFHNLTPYTLFHTLLTNNRAETLLKMGQTNLLRCCAHGYMREIESYWSSIKIATRHGYIIKDGTLWCDYIKLLRHFGKDTSSPKYLCPTDLKAEHDRLVERKRKEREREELRKRQAKAAESEELFHKLKSKFFGIAFSDGALQVRVLESVAEYVAEGTAMHHCLFTNDYYSKESSLILSATIEGKRVATIEISLDTLQVVQCRGVCNSHVAEQPQIIDLVNNNIDQIQQRITA